ncbi:hypothetical protein [Bradyrhizobium sp. HKCCYLS2038]
MLLNADADDRLLKTDREAHTSSGIPLVRAPLVKLPVLTMSDLTTSISPV